VKQRIPTIPMEGKSHLYVVRLNGSSPKQVGPGMGPVWSRTDNRVLHLDDRNRLTITDIDHGTSRRLLRDVRRIPLAGAGAWSPDGRKIAFVTGIQDNTEVFIMSADGGSRRKVTRSGGLKSGLQWVARENRILFTVNYAYTLGPEDSSVYSTDLLGLDLRRLTDQRTLNWTAGGLWGSMLAELSMAEYFAP
jgi:dipeptidyl aminopeptidase/acylaminoacyl peptidase